MSKPIPLRWLATAIPALGLITEMPAASAAEAGDPAIDVATERRPAGEIALSDDTLQLRYLGSIDQVNDARFNGTLFLSEERDLVLSSGLLFPLDYGGSRFDITAGPQAYAAMLRDENQDVFAISLGTEVRFFFDNRRRYAVSGQAFYAPDILTFGTANNLKDMSVRGELQVADRVMVFGGYRWFEFDLTDGNGERVLQEEVFVGLRYRF